MTGPRASRREWIGLAVIALPCLVYAMDLNVLNLALPSISADLAPSGTQLLWIVDIYGFMVAGALITMGALGDRIGARRMLLIGAGAFAVTSVLAAFATSAGMLIAARALLGLAGATLAPSTLSLIRTMFEDPRQRTFAIGVWATSYSVGAAIGPLAGGAVLELAWWGSVFLLGVPVMVLTLLLGPRLLPEHREGETGRVDVLSAALSLVAILAVIYGLKHLAVGGSLPGLWVALGFVAGALFVRRQQRLSDPLIDLSLFRLPAFSAALATNLVAFFVIFGMALFTAQYAQSVLGYSPLIAGLPTVTEALGFVVGSMLTARLAARFSAPVLISAGMGIGAFGYLIVAFTDQSLTPLFVGPTIGAIGLAFVITLVADLAVGAAPKERAGGAAATSETSSELGGALGLAILGSIGAAVYRAGVPARAPETIGDAVGTSFADPARDAFGTALTATASLSAAALSVAAVVAFVLLRRSAAAAPAAAAASSEGVG
ncbi:MFS transporter [Solirubrobacter ginsenosidimutans]|uniref:MFS transporter n=1 Tax=Solirubrobacter ginsenosidimutans TaxID=490573 RepID=A0A9X3MQN5_9ACTN|nr:MFS transporter [Solirubrobacter ginsenosidimutans]MDA0159438.1 MFS transporter [Solirubrobacter ginsenosidimutans]